MASSSRGTVVRPFEARDAAAVHRIWTDGFLEMSGDFTRSITGPAAAAVGVAALALSRSRLRGLAIAAAAAAAVPFLYRGGRRAIRRMCEEECATGNMSDIAATWHVPGFATFLVEVDARSGDVLGCIAVRRGSVRDVDAAPDAPLQAPDACSVWRVSVAVAARRRGVARSLMAAAERWAAEVRTARAGARTPRLRGTPRDAACAQCAWCNTGALASTREPCAQACNRLALVLPPPAELEGRDAR